jgi:hypothetical protein
MECRNYAERICEYCGFKLGAQGISYEIAYRCNEHRGHRLTVVCNQRCGENLQNKRYADGKQ